MGIDSVILLKAEEDIKLMWLPAGCFTVRIKSWNAGTVLAATHEVDNPYRYYGEDYTRGPWPLISAILLECLVHPHVESVWCMGDTSYHDLLTFDVTENGDYKPVGLEWIEEQTRRWVSESCWRLKSLEEERDAKEE